MTQSRAGSMFESIVNIIIGMGVAFASQLLIFPLFDIHIPVSSNLWIMCWFSVISVLRSYMVRRFFNTYIHRLAVLVTEKD